MSGIFLLVVAVIWVVITFYLAKVIAMLLPHVWWTYVLRTVLFVALLPLPLIDEIVGKAEFERLCRENSTIQIDRAKAAGRTVYLAVHPGVDVKGTWVRVVLQPWRFVDVNSGETVVSYNTLQAVGGVFVRTLGISEGQAPLLFNGSCVPPNRPASVQTFKELGINYIERPAQKAEK